jgi:ankyrin repeat protein
VGSAFNFKALSDQSPRNDSTKATATRPRRFQFSLKSLLVVIAITGVISGLVAAYLRNEARRQLPRRLTKAIQNDDLAEVDLILAIDPQQAHGRQHYGSSTSFTPLHWAIICADAKVIDRILKEQPDVNEKSDGGKSPLQSAVQRGLDACVTQLLDLGAEVNAVNKEGVAPLHFAVDRRDAILKLLISNGEDPNLPRPDGKTPLHLAAERSNDAAVVVLLKAGAHVNAVDSQGRTPLHVALSSAVDNRKVGQPLIDHGANLTAMDHAGLIPGKDVKVSDGGIAGSIWWDQIVKAFDSGNVAKIDQMFDVAPEALTFGREDTGESFLERAIREKRVDIFDYVIARRRGANLPDTHLSDTLRAVSWGQPEFVERLLDAGADVNSRSKTGRTALHVAATATNVAVLRLLLARGADVTAVDDAGTTVLDALFENTFHHDDRNALDLLRDAGHPPTLLSAAATGDLALLSQLSNDDLQALDRGYNATGIRPMHAAVLGGQTGVVQWLVKRGVDLNASNRGGPGRRTLETPLMMALGYNDTEIATMLINLGADVNDNGGFGLHPLSAVVAWDRSPKILEALLAHNVDLTVKHEKMTVRDLAKASKSKNRERYLELLGVSAEAQ